MILTYHHSSRVRYGPHGMPYRVLWFKLPDGRIVGRGYSLEMKALWWLKDILIRLGVSIPERPVSGNFRIPSSIKGNTVEVSDDFFGGPA